MNISAQQTLIGQVARLTAERDELSALYDERMGDVQVLTALLKNRMADNAKLRAALDGVVHQFETDSDLYTVVSRPDKYAHLLDVCRAALAKDGGQ